MYNFFFVGPENIALKKKLQKRTDAFIQSKLKAPSLATLKQWVLEDNPDIEWKVVKKTVHRFRNSMPIVSRNIPDGRATSARSQHLPRAFRSPAWVAADLGDFELRKNHIYLMFSGFMRLKGKNYGNFFIAIQTMSGQIFVKKLTSKKWIAIKPVIIKMLNTPGFELTKR